MSFIGISLHPVYNMKKKTIVNGSWKKNWFWNLNFVSFLCDYKLQCISHFCTITLFCNYNSLFIQCNIISTELNSLEQKLFIKIQKRVQMHTSFTTSWNFFLSRNWSFLQSWLFLSTRLNNSKLNHSNYSRSLLTNFTVTAQTFISNCFKSNNKARLFFIL